MSHNTSAVDVAINATPTGAGQTCLNGYNVVDLSQVCGLIQNGNSDIVGTVGYIEPFIDGNYYTDSVMQLEFTIYRFSNNQSSHAVVNGVQHDNTINSGWSMIGYEYENLNTGTGKLKLLFKHNVNSGSFRVRLRGNNGGWIFGLQPGDRVAGINYTIYAINDANAGASQIVNAINSMPNYSNNLNTINNNLNQVNNSINNINDDVEDATQNAANDAQDSADDAQADSEAATSSLLSVITGFFGAMANLNPTNCKFDSHLPFLTGNGQIDLCQVSAPPVVQAIGSLILIGIMVPFAIHMYNRFISITGSFQK